MSSIMDMVQEHLGDNGMAQLSQHLGVDANTAQAAAAAALPMIVGAMGHGGSQPGATPMPPITPGSALRAPGEPVRRQPCPDEPAGQPEQRPRHSSGREGAALPRPDRHGATGAEAAGRHGGSPERGCGGGPEPRPRRTRRLRPGPRPARGSRRRRSRYSRAGRGSVACSTRLSGSFTRDPSSASGAQALDSPAARDLTSRAASGSARQGEPAHLTPVAQGETRTARS